MSSTKRLQAPLITMIVLVAVVLLGTIFALVYENVKIDECNSNGGIYIQRQCVDPSWIH